MSSFLHYEDLRSVFARLDQVLPGRPRVQEQDSHEDGWDWRSTIIEAKPVQLHQLSVQAGIFRGEVPSCHQTSTGRRWYVTDKTRVHTSNYPVGPPTSLPAGTSLWHASEQARRLTVLAMHDARALFDEETQQCTLPAQDEWLSTGRLALFATPGPAELCFRDAITLLEPRAPYLARLAQAYARSIAWVYGMQHHEIQEACRLHITWHSQASRTPACMPPASPCRYENGPIVRIGIGRPVVTHDLIPALPDPSCAAQEHAARVEVSEGVMLITDGTSRMRYSHGHPCNTSGKDWLSLTFFMDCTRQSLAVAYDRETRSVIMATPIRKDRVVATSDPDQLPCPPSGVGLDLMGVLVKDLRLRLRIAESHVMVKRHLSRPRGEPVPCSSSSRMSLE